MAESIKSIYKPSNPEKYQGNSNNIICRSSWERRFCAWCDNNPNILKWASEEFSIPYISPKDNRVHRYYPDYLIEVKESGGRIKKYVVEVKPRNKHNHQRKVSVSLNHMFMSPSPMLSTRQSGKQQRSFVKIMV